MAVHFSVRGHGKFYETDASLIHPNDLGGITIHFYAPPGAALAGDVADDIVVAVNRGSTGGYQRPVKLVKREHSEYQGLPDTPPAWDPYPVICTTPFQGGSTAWSQPGATTRGTNALNYPMADAGFLANWTLSGDSTLDYNQLTCGLYYRGNLVHGLANNEEILLSDLIAMARKAADSRDRSDLHIHWAACSSVWIKNQAFINLAYTGYKATYR